MAARRDPPSRLTKLGFKVPVWLYQAHLGVVFFGHVFAIVHHGRKSGQRHVSGLEPIVRREGELFVFSAWGRDASWFRNIEASGVDELWDGRHRYGSVTFRVVEPDEADEILARYEREQPRTAKRTLPRMLEGYDSSDEMRRQLAASGTIVAFRPAD